ISIWSHHNSLLKGKISHTEWLKMCGEELKVDGVELLDFGFQKSFKNRRIPREPELKKIKKLCADLQLSIYLVSCGNNFGFSDKKLLKKEITYVKKWVDVAFYLGAPVLRFFAGRPVPKEKREAGWKSLIYAVRECVKYAEKKGIVFAVENHNHGGFISTSADYFRLKKAVKSPYFKLCLDTGNFVDLYKSIGRTLKEAPVVHAKLYKVMSGKEKKLDYEKIFKLLKKNKYNGFLSIEYEGEENEFKAGKNSVKYLKRMIEKYKY
ncbi:MAG: sugar phosphate isomerase/epimerase family protein, partial [Candidatus Firestonebacteria bacterium]